MWNLHSGCSTADAHVNMCTRHAGGWFDMLRYASIVFLKNGVEV